MENNEIEQGYAKLNITYAGSNGDLPDPVAFDAADGDIKQWATEAIRNGSVPGISANEEVDFSDFVVDRFEANEVRPFALVQIRPKTPFGK